MINPKNISVIICVYNEEKTIMDVILSIVDYFETCEIIVVNDGSTDKTEQIIKRLQLGITISYVPLQRNMGKGYAMAIGLENATNDTILFVDADQRETRYEYIETILDSFYSNNKVRMVLGYTTVNIAGREVNPMKILTGERILFKSDLLPLLPKMKESRFGVETLLYLFYRSKGYQMDFVHLSTLKHLTKYEKSPFFQATRNYIVEGHEILVTAFKNRQLIKQSIKNKFNVDLKDFFNKKQNAAKSY